MSASNSVHSYILRSFTQMGDSTCQSMSSLKRNFSFAISNGGCVEVPRWPVASLDGESLEIELGNLLRDSFATHAFDVFELTRLTGGHPLKFVGWEALYRGESFQRFEIPIQNAQLFLQRIEERYGESPKIPYHNNVHAADVTQTVHAWTCDEVFEQYLQPMDTFLLVLSAAIHDMGHDGRNNNFHLSTCSELALTYNDKSVQENYHVSSAFKLFAHEPETNLLCGLEKTLAQQVRKEMVDMVLSTDMSTHFKKLGTFNNLASANHSGAEAWRDDQAAMAELRGYLLHACDVSHPSKTFRLHEQWTGWCTTEFFAQGDEEKLRGLPVSMLCDRVTTDIASAQVGFLQFIVQPTFVALSSLKTHLGTLCTEEISKNIELWKERRGPAAKK